MDRYTGFRMGAGHQKYQPCHQKVGILSHPDFQRGEEKLEIEFSPVVNDLINHALCNETPIKTLDSRHSGASWMVNESICQEV